MNLLKELPKNFRYYLLTSKSNKVYILYNKFSYDIEENEETTMETTYLESIVKSLEEVVFDGKPTKDEFISNQTLKKTVNYNEVNIDKFYEDVYEYVKARKGKNINTIKLVNYNIDENGIVFTNNIYKVISDCLGENGELEVDIKRSALRVHNEQYTEIKSLKWLSGNLLVEDSSPTLYFKTIYIEQCTVDTHNKDSDAEFINIVAREKANIINIKVLSVLRMNILGDAVTAESYSNSKLLISSYIIFGNEYLANDSENPRLTVSRFRACTIDSMWIMKDVSYGSIVKCDKLLTFTINRINREIGETGAGTPIIIGSVANVMLSRIELNITRGASIPSKSALITFNPDDSGLRRKINIYNTNIRNDLTLETFYLFKLSSVKINKIYISECTFQNGMNILDMTDDSSVEKFFLDNSVIKTSDSLKLDNIIKLTLFKSTIQTEGILSISPQRFNLENNNLKFKSMLIRNEKEPIIKFSSSENVISGTDFVMQNPASDYCSNFYDTKSVFEVKNLISEGYNCSFDSSYLKCSNIRIGGDNTIKLIYPNIAFPDTKYESNIVFKSTVNGNIILDNSDYVNKCKFNINIEDEIKYLTTENLSITCTNKSPVINFVTNMPIEGKLVNFDKNSKIHMKVSNDYETKQKMNLICMNSNSDKLYDYPIILNDSEQKLTLTNIPNEYENKTFIFTKK